jgi:hypothetical protein
MKDAENSVGYNKEPMFHTGKDIPVTGRGGP